MYAGSFLLEIFRAHIVIEKLSKTEGTGEKPNTASNYKGVIFRSVGKDMRGKGTKDTHCISAFLIFLFAKQETHLYDRVISG